MTPKRRLDTPPQARHYRRSAIVACGMVAGALLVGMLGYRFFNRESWIDSFVDAAMILGGMGPVTPLANDGAKFFAGCYALFSGLIFVGSAAVLVAPWLHALLHRLHAEDDDET
ncbi:MAG: hypothetical protein U1F37_14760 [Alphaproteobacteria bacterium]